MGKMIRQKREWICNKCGYKHIKWQGFCNNCKASSTLEEFYLVRPRVKATEAPNARRLRRRAKDSERNIAKRMVAADGKDPNFEGISSSTGRIGHISAIRVDAVSRSYMTENKNRKLPTWLIQAWTLINQRGNHFNKKVLLHIDPPNMPKTVPSDGQTIKIDTMAVVPLGQFEELVKTARHWDDLTGELFKEGTDLASVRALFWTLQQQEEISK